MQKSLANQIKGVCQALLQEIVPRTGVEPVISALKGRRPWPHVIAGALSSKNLRYNTSGNLWYIVRRGMEMMKTNFPILY